MAENFGTWVLSKATGYRETKYREGCALVKYAVTESRQMIRTKVTASGSTVVTVVFAHEIHTAK